MNCSNYTFQDCFPSAGLEWS